MQTRSADVALGGKKATTKKESSTSLVVTKMANPYEKVCRNIHFEKVLKL
jgi:hypothetical protein